MMQNQALPHLLSNLYFCSCIIRHDLAPVSCTGLELNESAISQALNDIGIQEPDWKQIGETILKKPLKGHVSPTEFYKKWSQSAKSHLSWPALSDALGQTGNLAAAEMARIKEGNVQKANEF